VLLGKALIHAEDFAAKSEALVAAGAGANFEDDVLLVVGILWAGSITLISSSRAGSRGASLAISSSAMAFISGSANIARASARPRAPASAHGISSPEFRGR